MNRGSKGIKYPELDNVTRGHLRLVTGDKVTLWVGGKYRRDMLNLAPTTRRVYCVPGVVPGRSPYSRKAVASISAETVDAVSAGQLVQIMGRRELVLPYLHDDGFAVVVLEELTGPDEHLDLLYTLKHLAGTILVCYVMDAAADNYLSNWCLNHGVKRTERSGITVLCRDRLSGATHTEEW